MTDAVDVVGLWTDESVRAMEEKGNRGTEERTRSRNVACARCRTSPGKFCFFNLFSCVAISAACTLDSSFDACSISWPSAAVLCSTCACSWLGSRWLPPGETESSMERPSETSETEVEERARFGWGEGLREKEEREMRSGVEAAGWERRGIWTGVAGGVVWVLESTVTAAGRLGECDDLRRPAREGEETPRPPTRGEARIPFPLCTDVRRRWEG